MHLEMVTEVCLIKFVNRIFNVVCF